jgi:hypothetical protein
MSDSHISQLAHSLGSDMSSSRLTRSFNILDRPLSSTLIATAVLLAIQLMMAFPYFWTGNEENYFALARQWIAPETTRPFDAAFDTSRGKFVGLLVFGFATHLLGDDAGRLVIGIMAFTLVGFGFAKMTQVLGLSLIDMIIVFTAFLLCGQSFFGGEWFIGGIETKTFAYGFGLVALAGVVEKQTLRPAIWCAVATYFHFLVGAFWIGSSAFLILLIASPRRAGEFAGLVLIFVAPVIIAITGDIFLASSVVPPPGLPPADYIYSILRAPHHVAPFVSSGWARPVGAALFTSFAIAALLIIWGRRSLFPLQKFAFVIAGLALCIPIAFIFSWFDRETGMLGKFYLFRPASPILLLSLFAIAGFWRQRTFSNMESRVMPGILVAVILALTIISGNFRASVTRIPDPIRELAIAIRVHTGISDPILLDPSIDAEPSLSRLANRSTVVNWKFVPTNSAQIYRWWTLLQLRKRVFDGQCPVVGSAFRYAVATREGANIIAKCGNIEWQSRQYVLIKLR